MNCPKCSSENTQTLRMIFESGTSNSSSTSKSHGGGFFNVLPTFRAKTNTVSTSQSLLATSASPPVKKSLIGTAIATLIGLYFLVGAFSPSFNFGWLLFGVLWSGLFGFVTYANFNFNTKVFPKDLEDWEKTWRCHKCGTVYQE